MAARRRPSAAPTRCNRNQRARRILTFAAPSWVRNEVQSARRMYRRYFGRETLRKQKGNPRESVRSRLVYLRAMADTRVLVVDDDPTIRELLAEYLGEHGYAVTLAASGEAMRAEME